MFWNQWAYLGRVCFLSFCDLKLFFGFWILRGNFLVWFLSFENHDQKQKWTLDNFEGNSSKWKSQSRRSLWVKKCFLTLRGHFLVLFLSFENFGQKQKLSLDNFAFGPIKICMLLVGQKVDYFLYYGCDRAAAGEGGGEGKLCL